jgi:Protein of unknown function (DUF551)
MNKTPEELAEELDRQAVLYVSLKARNDVSYYVGMRCYKAGYQAAKEHAHAALEEAEAEIDRLQTKLSDAGILTTEHIFDMEKMVDVSSSETLNNWISVKDRLPEIKNRMSEHVLILDEYGQMSVKPFEIVNNEIVVDWGEAGTRPLSDVTHWMPLPKPPTE